MYTNLAPVGLPSPSKAKQQRSQQGQIERSLTGAVGDFVHTDRSLSQKISYNMAHPNTSALVKSFDKFFAHGLIKMDKSYWSFVRELIPGEERVDLKRRWSCASRRELSLAWLKDSLNRRNLQFQMFGFIACAEELKQAHYERTACLRNKILLKRICLLLDDIAELQFHIEPPYIFRTEDTPIALPITQADGTMSPVQSSNSSLIGIQFSPNLPMNIHRKREANTANRMSIGSSFCEVARNSYLDGLVHDLPEVNLASLSTVEPIVQSAKEQSYILDEMLRNQRKGIANNSSAQFFIEEEEEEQTANANAKVDSNKESGSDSVRSLIPEDPCASSSAGQSEVEEQKQLGHFLISQNSRTDEKQQQKAEAASEEAKELLQLPSALSSNSLGEEEEEGSSSSQGNDELSGLNEDEVLLEGEVFLDSGEIIQIQLELCIRDGERVQRMFQVFTGHATGQPLQRYLLLTDQFIYLLAGQTTAANESEEEEEISRKGDGGPDHGLSPGNSNSVDEMAAEAFERNLMRLSNAAPKKFKILIALPLCDLDHLTVGVDAQVLCFHSRHAKFRLHPQSGHEQRTFLVETCSRVLGKTIAFAVQRTVAAQASSSSNSTALDEQQQQQQQMVTPLSITCSHSSQLGIVLKRFVRRELGVQRPEIVHLSLVYWHQQASPRLEHQQQQSSPTASSSSPTSLECYFYVRELHQRSWTTLRGAGDWQQSYVVLRGLMLYQFSDSSYKYAQRSLNLRDAVEEVCRVDLKNDEKYTFQLTFAQDAVDDGLSALQFSCPNTEVMNKWISALSLALSISGEAPLPVACMAILTETHMLFAQEGMNCFIDGFMRSLCSFHIHESAEIFSVRSDFNTALVIRRDNGLDEWLMFRERGELDRLVECLRQRWQLPVTECSNDNLLKAEFDQLLLECARMPDLWRTVPRSSLD